MLFHLLLEMILNIVIGGISRVLDLSRTEDGTVLNLGEPLQRMSAYPDREAWHSG